MQYKALFNLVKGLQSYKAAKLALKRKIRHFGFEATFFEISLLKTWSLGKGAFNNHVDKILPILHHPPTPSGQTWTFGLPPTPCPRGQLKNDHPQLDLKGIYLILLRGKWG